MKLRYFKLKPRARLIDSILEEQSKNWPRGKYVMLSSAEKGYDEHNLWTAYLIWRFK